MTLRLVSFWLSSIGLLGLAGCSAQDAPPSLASRPPSAVASELLPAVGSDAWRALPAAERAQRIRVAQTSAAPEFALAERAPEVFTADHRTMALRTTLSKARAALDTAEGSSAGALDMHVVTWGCAEEMSAVPEATPELRVAYEGEASAAVVYRHEGFDEWYAPGPLGVEQGFTVRELPACAERGAPLRFALALGDQDGVETHLTSDGSEAVLHATGRRELHFSDAFAQDAAGVEHGVRFRNEGPLVIEVETGSTPLPLIVDPLAWVQQVKLLAPKPAPSDAFGAAAATYFETLLVGAAGDDQVGIDAGAAYVYVRSGATWALQQKLTAADGAPGDFFGAAVALAGDTAIVGAFGDDTLTPDTGSAYVFVRTGTTWFQQAKIVAGDAVANDHFGASVAVSGDNAIIGAPLRDNASNLDSGAAYPFARNGTIWAQKGPRLSPTGAAKDHGGTAVAMAGTLLAIGTDRTPGYAVNFYNLLNGNWTLATTGNLVSTLPSLSHFGSSLAMTPALTVIGGYADDVGAATTPGAVIVNDNKLNTQVALRPLDGAANDQFGTSVAIAGTTVFVGSPKDDDLGTDSGSVYVFNYDGSGWAQTQKITAGAAGDAFGSVVALETYSAIGAPLRDDGATNAGAAYAFGFGLTNGSSCAKASECGSGFCVQGVCCNTACTGTCVSCLAKDKVGADGTCGSVKATLDPYDNCASSPAESCGLNGLCDGNGACAYYPTGASCTATSCATATSAAASSNCSAGHQCLPTMTITCQAGYNCVSGNCATSCKQDSDCDFSKGYVCSPSGTCLKPKGASCDSSASCSTGACQYGTCCFPEPNGLCIKPLGIACNANSECSSQICSAGVCCNKGCTGTCESCKQAASLGTCIPLTTGACTPTSGGGSGGGAGAVGIAGGSSGGGASGSYGGIGGAGGKGASAGRGGASPSAGQGGATSSSGGASPETGGSAGTFPTGGMGGLLASGARNATEEDDDALPTARACRVDADCKGGLACDPDRHVCADELVRGCTCRLAPPREARRDLPSPYLGLLGLLGLALERRRRGRAIHVR